MKPLRIFSIVILITTFVFTAKECIDTFSANRPFLERYFYAALALFTLLIFDSICRRPKGRWQKVATGGVISLIFTATLFLANNLWRYLGYNSLFGWDEEIPYTLFLATDITYTYKWGFIRYPLVFCLMAGICGVYLLVTSAKAKRLCKTLIQKGEQWLFLQCEKED